MKRDKISSKSFLPVGLAVLLVTCLLTNLIIIPVFADDDGFALRFDGTTDFVQLPLTTTIFDTGWETTKSVALWVKPDGTPTACTTMADPYAVSACNSIFGDLPTFWGISIGYLTGPALDRIWVWNYDNSIGSPYDMVGITYTPGVWTHVALVHSGGVLRAFKNGVEVGSTASGATITPSGSAFLTLGGVIINSTTHWLLQGDIDEVSLWDRALTGPEITANLYQDAPTDLTGLAAFYRMTDGAGTVLTDDSGNGNTGTLRDGRAGLVGNGTFPLWVDSGAFDVTGPTVTINQAAGQADPTNDSPITFDVVFSETVTDFDDLADVNLSASTVGGTLSAAISGSGTNYTVTVTGMNGSGQVIASIPAGAALSATLVGNNASTSTDNSVTFDNVSPTVTINQAAGQADPTNASPIHFTVVFSEAVTDFATGDVSLSGTAGATTATVSGSGATYDVAVSGMTGAGTVIATIAAGVAHDAAGNLSAASTSSDNTVTYTTDTTGPTVTINQAVLQDDPTNASPVEFTVVFSEAVTDFATGDVSLSGTAGATTATVSGSGVSYTVAVSGMTGNGTVIATIAAGVAHDSLGNPNSASTSTDNTVTYDATAPTVTINQAGGQADPTNASPIHFTVVFNEAVTDFATGDVSLSGTAGATTATVSGSGATYDVAVSGMTGNGTVIATVAAGVAHDAAGNPNAASTSSDNTVTYTSDTTGPTVTINQATGQADPTNASPVHFTVVFNEAVTDFATGDVSLSGTAGATTATVSGSGATYDVAVSGMTGNGTVIATIAAGVAHDAVGNPNSASTSSDNTVTYDATAPTVTINQAAGQADPASTEPIFFTVVFSEAVTDFAAGDVTLSGDAGATTATVTGSGTTYTVEVSGMTGSGTVIATIPAGAAHDAAGNASAASTSTDNTVTYIFQHKIYLPLVFR